MEFSGTYEGYAVGFCPCVETEVSGRDLQTESERAGGGLGSSRGTDSSSC